MVKRKVTAPQMENGANGSTIRETVRARWPTSIQACRPRNPAILP